MGTATYLIGIGSNMRTKLGSPRTTLESFLCAFAPLRESETVAQRALKQKKEWELTRRRKGAKEVKKGLRFSRIHSSRPVGPGTRRYANAVAAIQSDLLPPALLVELKRIERAYGRRPGLRWGDRPLDLDIIAWSGGIWASPKKTRTGLTIPHTEFRKRRFVLAPLCEIAPDWRDPVTHLTARHLLARLDRKRPRA